MAVDGDILEVAVEQREREVRSRVRASGDEVQLAVKKRILHRQINQANIRRTAAAEDFLDLEDVPDLVRGEVAADTVDDQKMQLQPGPVGEFLQVQVQAEVDLVRVRNALSLAADGIGGGLAGVAEGKIKAAFVQPGAGAVPVARQRAGGAVGRGRVDGAGDLAGGRRIDWPRQPLAQTGESQAGPGAAKKATHGLGES